MQWRGQHTLADYPTDDMFNGCNHISAFEESKSRLSSLTHKIDLQHTLQTKEYSQAGDFFLLNALSLDRNEEVREPES